MQQRLEVETKFELNSTDFERLKSLGRVTRCEEQLNVYYDTQWRLAESSTTLRIRFEDGTDPVLTLKVPVTRNGEKRIMREFDLRLTRYSCRLSGSSHPTRIDVKQELPQELGDCLLCMGVRHVHRVGWVRNTRVVVAMNDIGAIELDRLELPDGSVFYEAEIESADPWSHDQLAHLVHDMAPHAKPSRVSKFQRFRHAATKLSSQAEFGDLRDAEANNCQQAAKNSFV